MNQLKSFHTKQPSLLFPIRLSSNDSVRRAKGFTIVELLIVIVIIGILATIVIVAYNGITKKARIATLQSDISNNVSAAEIYNATNGSYPASGSDLNDSKGLTNSGSNTSTYTTNSDKTAYCIQSVGPDNVTYAADNAHQNPIEGTCSGVVATAGGGGSGNPTTMQAFTSSNCSALTIYDGTNSSALITLQDTRADQKSYTIGKLADGHCWMLDNLKLGSTTGTTTLTPSDSNVATNFTLPQVKTTGAKDYNVPYAFGPVTGDTGSGATNYGYLYNWPAATAGETTTTKPVGSSNASYSICPKGWRLPSGNTSTSDFATLDKAFGGTGAYQSSGPSIAKWNYAGPFRGVLAGDWSGSFSNQSSYGNLWSSSPYSSSANFAMDASFDSGSIFPGTDYSNRYYGFGVRCLLN